MIHTAALAMLIAANGTPVLVARMMGNRFSAPIDGGRVLADGHRLLGSHKTWRGLFSGALAAALVGSLLGEGAIVGATFGLFALAGDLISSFWKRRLGCESGRDRPFLDQLPEALLPMALLGKALGIGAVEMIVTALVFTLLDVLATRMMRSGASQATS